MKHLYTFIIVFLTTFLPVAVHAQERIHVHLTDQSESWDFPYVTEDVEYFDIDKRRNRLRANVTGGIIVPFDPEKVDSITFENEPLEESKDPYQVYQMYITTTDGKDVVSRDTYQDCYISLNAKGAFSNYSASGKIRCRGNSSFLWYDKKPYRIKLDEKHKLLGLGKAKSWALLANYRDVTDLMNTFVFELGHWMGLEYTNHTRYVELFLNGDYKGVYQLTEQIQQNANRVNISDEMGILVTLDVDDGPGESPYNDDNFWSSVYNMPMAVKYPEDEMLTSEVKDSIKGVFAQLETAIKNRDYPLVESLLDIRSFIHYLQIQEFIYNVELSAPRSIYMYKDGDGKWMMGPLWDFDAGFDFDWNYMQTNHTFFSNYRETVMGTNPYKRNGNYNYVPQFFTNLFGCSEFVKLYKEEWNCFSDSIVSRNWAIMEKYITHLSEGPMTRESKRWPITGKNFDEEVKKMHQWLINRANFMTELINNIPEPDDAPITDEQLCGTMTCNVRMDKNNGYDQRVTVNVDKNQLLGLLGEEAATFKENKLTVVPLNTDGTEGQNYTNGVFGGWFDAEGNPRTWNEGHIYIEIYDDLFHWSCGVHPYNCFDDNHVVTMQMQYPSGGTLKKVNVKVNFTIDNQGGWWW